MSGCPVPQRQGERVHEGGQRWGSWSPAAELKASPPLVRPQNGSIILYNRKKVKYRKDGYLWKKRKDGKTTREDHMKLKVQGMEVRQVSSSQPRPSAPAALLRPQRGSGPPPPTLPATPLLTAVAQPTCRLPRPSVTQLSRTQVPPEAAQARSPQGSKS